MKHLFVALGLVSLLAVPALAVQPPSSAFGSFSWQDGKDLPRTWSLEADIDFPLNHWFSIGPVLRAQYFGDPVDDTVCTPNEDPESPGDCVNPTSSTTVWSAGIQATAYLTGPEHNGIHVGIAAVKTFSDLSQYVFEPYIGFQQSLWDGKRTSGAFRARFSHLFTTGVGDDDFVDLEQNKLAAGFGLLF